MSTYQVMPPLTSEEREALRQEIAEHGVIVPVVTDQHGNILDGHHRAEIADGLGVDFPTEVRDVADGDEAHEIALALNLARRHLTRQQKRPDRLRDRATPRRLGSGDRPPSGL